MAEHKVAGGTMLLFIDPTGGTDYDMVVCLTSVGKNNSVNVIDGNTMCGYDKTVGDVTIDYNFEGFHLQNPDTGKISGTSLLELLRNKTKIGFKIAPESLVGGDEIEEGTGYITELSATYSFDAVGSFSGTITPNAIPVITIGPADPYLRMTFSDASFPVGTPTNVSDWNAFFDLPTNGTAFTSAEIIDSTVYLRGGANITIKQELFLNNYNLTAINDLADCIKIIEEAAFSSCINLKSIELPKVESIGYTSFSSTTSTIYNFPSCINISEGGFINCGDGVQFIFPKCINIESIAFYNCTDALVFDLRKCEHLGPTTADDSVFELISGQTITLTIPAALMTCNAGTEDRDIEYLNVNNDVTIVTV